MFAFILQAQPETGQLIARNAHVKGEAPATVTTNSLGVIVSVENVTIADLADAGLARMMEDGTSYRLVKLSDRSEEAQAVLWGDLAEKHLCTCPVEPAPEDWARFERHDEQGQYTGQHGFVCRRCHGIVQVG